MLLLIASHVFYGWWDVWFLFLISLSTAVDFYCGSMIDTGRLTRSKRYFTSLYAVQIYCDFSGYSDMARGVSKLFGIELMVNFNLPYFSKDPSEFWHRWHISLSTWLRDYLYIPLGGSRQGNWRTYQNMMTTMVLGGLWHGAAWNFVL